MSNVRNIKDSIINRINTSVELIKDIRCMILSILPFRLKSIIDKIFDPVLSQLEILRVEFETYSKGMEKEKNQRRQINEVIDK